MAGLGAVCRPLTGDAAVAVARASLSDTLRLDAVPTRLSQCSARLARARGAAAPFADVRGALADAGGALVRAAAGARGAAAQFAAAARAALDDLDDARDLLQAGAPGAARAALRAARARAQALAKPARSVALALEAAAARVAAAEEAARARADTHAAAQARAAAAAAHARAALAHARDRRALAASALDEAHALYTDAAARERSARTRAAIAHTAQLAAVAAAAAAVRSPRLALLGASGVGAIARVADDGVMRAREEKAVFLAQKMRARDRQLDAAKTIEGLSADLRCAGDGVDVDEKALAALADVVAELRALGAAFLDVEGFWMRLRAFCEDEHASPIDQLVDEATGLPMGDQIALWESPRFCARMKAAYAHWAALLTLCEECVKGLDEKREALYRHIAAEDPDEQETSVLARD